MTQDNIDRINALAHKAKTPEGLTPEEIAERDKLRAAYIADMRRSLTDQLERITLVEPDGSRHPLKKKDL